MDTLYDQLWDAVSKVRDASPRAVNDASTDDVVEAVLDVLGELRTRTEKAEAAIRRVRGVLDELEVREQESVSSDADAYGSAWMLLRDALDRQG